MRAIIAMTGAELRRFLRDRSNIFFVFIFPLLLVLVIGSQFGGGGPSGNVTISATGGDSALAQDLEDVLTDRGLSVRHAGADEARSAVARGRTDVAVFVPADPSEQTPGAASQIEFIAGSSGGAITTAQEVRSAIGVVGLERSQVAALSGAGIEPDDAAGLLEQAQAISQPQVEVEDLDPLAGEFAGLGRFDLGATSQLLLFTFLSTLAGSATLIQARREKVIARALSAPVSTTQVLVGQAAGRWLIAFSQGAYIMVATTVLFGVQWGNWGLSLLILAVFAAVAAGAAMVIGAMVDNEGAASGVGVGVGLVLAGLGGGMAPLEIFSDTMRQVAQLTPHAWAYEAYAEVQRHGGSLADIAPQLGVLVAMALGALALGVWALRRSVARAM